MNIGRAVGARRVLFVWSAMCVAVSLYIAVANGLAQYQGNFIVDMNTFVLTGILGALMMFLKLFSPMLIIVIATKLIFDCGGKHLGRASETFRLSFFSSATIGVIIAALYYLNAGHIIGSNPSLYCGAGDICLFSWNMLEMAGKVFLIYFAGFFALFLALRGIYEHISYPLEKRV
jgi:hypothetical protein